MSEEASNNEKIIAIPKDKYVKVTYLLLIVSSGLGILNSLLAWLAGITLLGSIGGLAGLAGLVLAILGFFVFKDKFNEQQISHFKNMGALLLIFYVAGIVVGAVLGGLGIITYLIMILLSIASLACMFAGFKLNEKNAVATKDAAIAQLKSLSS